MRRILIDRADETVKLTGEDHKHLSTVKRAATGDKIQATCGDGLVYTYEISGISKTETFLKKLDAKEDNSESDISVTLFMPVLKGDKNELVVQKATELGVKRIVPFVSTYSQAKSIRKERLEKIAREAVMQCGRSYIPEICEVTQLNELNKQLSLLDAIVFPYEKEKSRGLKELLKESDGIKNLGIIVGSEGGFSDAEAEELARLARPVSLGKRILRAETACIAVLSAVMYELGEWS